MNFQSRPNALLLAVGWITAMAAQAQAQAPNSPQRPASAPTDAAAMERAQREADGPRRRILEAARLRVASKPPEAVNARIEPALTPGRSARAPPPVAPTASPPAAQSAPATAALPASPAAAPQIEPSTTQAVVARPLPEPAPTPAAVAPPGARAAVPDSPTVAPGALPPPRLLESPELEIPVRRLGRRAAATHEAVVQLTINPDGSVSGVDVRSVTAPELHDPILEAVRRWRYEPQPVSRPHTLHLVIKPA